MRKLLLSVSLSVVCLSVAGYSNAEDSSSYQWQSPTGPATATLDVAGSLGTQHFNFSSQQAVALNASMLRGDGVYRWQLNYSPVVSAALLAQAEQRRAAGDSSLPPGWPQALPVSNGILQVLGGQFVAMDLEESDPPTAPVPNAQVIVDDLIVQGSACVGFDCVNAESFGSDTFRLKENNLRINFDDTSTGGNYPENDWRIVANDSTNGGASYLAFEDSTAGVIPFLVEAGAPVNALYVEEDGDVGFGTSSPAVNLHTVDGNTPTLRLDQNGSNGFTPQIWDLAGNETNFIIRDVTNGSLLPFRIRPGAPTSSIEIGNTGNIGFGITNSSAALQIRRPTAFTNSLIMVDAPDDSDPTTEERRLSLDSSGNLFVGGTITQLSSKFSKENLVAVAGSAVLDRLRKLDLWTWNYRASTSADRHLGPVAEDFYRSFGLGVSERSVAPADMAGVALAASQALTAEIDQRDQHISTLEARIARLEAALEKLTDAKE